MSFLRIATVSYLLVKRFMSQCIWRIVEAVAVNTKK